MPLNIKNDETEALARELAGVTGESLTAAITEALRLRLTLVRREQRRPERRAQLRRLQDFVTALPDRDPRPADELLGYDPATGLLD